MKLTKVFEGRLIETIVENFGFDSYLHMKGSVRIRDIFKTDLLSKKSKDLAICSPFWLIIINVYKSFSFPKKRNESRRQTNTNLTIFLKINYDQVTSN